jgi:Ca2+-binding RTX toxin-like protein
MSRNKFKSRRRFERLEDRRLMAGSDLSDGVLSIEGSENADVIAVSYKALEEPGDEPEVLVEIHDRVTGELIHECDYNLDEVTRIEAFGFGGNDEIINEVNIQAFLYGGNGDDTLESRGSANDTLDGGANNDTYRFVGNSLGSDRINEATNVGVDTLDFTSFGGRVGINLAATVEQIVRTDHLRLRLSSSTGIENVIGSAFADTIYGNSRDNTLSGLGDVDYLYGREGVDTLRGGEGDDWLYGEGGNDDLFGGNGRDRLWGGAGDDDLFGEAGNDSLYGESGLDTLSGGTDNDFLDGGYDGLNDVYIGGSGADTFVLHRRRTNPGPTEQTLSDYASAVDYLMTAFH